MAFYYTNNYAFSGTLANGFRNFLINSGWSLLAQDGSNNGYLYRNNNFPFDIGLKNSIYYINDKRAYDYNPYVFVPFINSTDYQYGGSSYFSHNGMDMFTTNTTYHFFQDNNRICIANNKQIIYIGIVGDRILVGNLSMNGYNNSDFRVTNIKYTDIITSTDYHVWVDGVSNFFIPETYYLEKYDSDKINNLFNNSENIINIRTMKLCQNTVFQALIYGIFSGLYIVEGLVSYGDILKIGGKEFICCFYNNFSNHSIAVLKD